MASTNEIEDIQDIDETCGEEYVENFAPRAQEEILIEIQDNQNDSEQVEPQSNRNEAHDDIISKTDDLLECNEVSNEEEIQETSDQLIKEVITDAELNLNEEEQFHVTDDNNIDNSQDSETNIENVNSDDKNVDVEMEEPSDDNIQKFEQEPEEAENIQKFEQEPEEAENIQKFEQEPEEAENIQNFEQEPEEVENIQNFEQEPKEAENIEINDESNVSELKENVEEYDESNLETPEIEQEKIADINETKPIEGDCVNVKQTEAVVSPIKGKDVKSLSSTYGREENITNGDCCICNKVVYPMEKLSTNDRLYHKTCFRCTKCKNALSTGNFTFNQGKPYCTPHYVELFKKRGRYDEIDNNIEAEHSIVADNNESVADELPAPDTTKNILAKFRDLQSNAGSNPNSTSVADSPSERPLPNTTKNLTERFTALGQEKPEMKCKPKIDIPRQSNGHTNGSSENEPVVLPKDVIRSNDPGQDDKPEQGITKNLVNRFRELESGSTN